MQSVGTVEFFAFSVDVFDVEYVFEYHACHFWSLYYFHSQKLLRNATRAPLTRTLLELSSLVTLTYLFYLKGVQRRMTKLIDFELPIDESPVFIFVNFSVHLKSLKYPIRLSLFYTYLYL